MSQPFLATLMIPTEIETLIRGRAEEKESQPFLATLMIPTAKEVNNAVLG